MEHFTDRLFRLAESKGGAVCIGIDPVYERLPSFLRGQGEGAEHRLAAIEEFVETVMQSVLAHVPVVKFQSACFERYQTAGIEVFLRLIRRARELGLLVIADVKRGDIGPSAAHYASAWLGDDAVPDAITVNAWCGSDGIDPFVEAAAQRGRGLFVWVRASNPSSDRFQGLRLSDGRTVAQAMAQIVAEAGSAPSLMGHSGYSLVGAVVGATKAQEAATLRQLMPTQCLLVPGFGVQGGSDSDLRSFFDDLGRGALVTASRSVLYAFHDDDRQWAQAIEAAAVHFKQQINAVQQAPPAGPG